MKLVTVPVVATLLATAALGFHSEPAKPAPVRTVDSVTAVYIPTVPVVPATGELIPPLTITAPRHSAPVTVIYEPNAPGVTDTPGNTADNPAIYLSCEMLSNGPDTSVGNGKAGWYPVVIASDVATANGDKFRNCVVWNG